MINKEINSKTGRLITEKGNEVINTKEALAMAKEQNLDLFCISQEEIPVVKIGDYSKYLYERKKKEKENKKKQKPVSIKEINISESTELNDLKTKARQIDKFLSSGNKVKLSIKYRGRSIKFINEGPEKLNNLVNLLTEQYSIDSNCKTAGNFVSMVIAPKK